MNLDPLSFSLSEIEYDLNTLSKATYKNNSGEITQIVNYFGFEAERHVFKGVYVEIDLSDVRSGKDAPQEINTGHKPNFTTLLCYALENIIENQKNVKIPVIITNLLKVAKLSKLEEIVYALSLQYSSNNEVKDFTLNFLKQKLPEFFKLYIEGKITVITKDSDINCEIIYLFISALFNHENNLGISEDQYKKILRTLRRDFPFERAPLILAPFISSSSIHSTEGFTSQDGILVKKLVTELPSITKTMVDVSKLVVELGYDFCCSLETCQTNLIEIGVHEITPASVARILGAMANTHTGLNNGITLYFDKKESYPPTFVDEQQQFQSCTGPTSAITSGGSLDYVETSTTYLLNNLVGETINKNNSSPAVSSNSSSSAFTWNADIFVKAVKEVVPHFHWRDVVYELDQPGLVLKDKPGFKLITGAITQGLESNMETFPYDFFYRTWNNSEEQLSWLELIVKYPDVFRFADFPSRQVSTDILKLNPEEECDPRIAIWKSLDMIEALLKLSERGHYQRVQELFRFPLQYCPDVLILALLQIKGLLTLLGQDLIATLIPHFLTNNSNSLIVLQIAWHNQFHSHIARTLIMHSMADWYVKDPNDQTRLSRILDIAQDLKALSLLLNCSPYGFIIDLACLASRREYLKLEKWLTEKIREHSEPFIWALVYFLKRRCPGAFSHMANSNSAIVNLLCSDIKEANLPKVLQLPSDIVNGIMTTLQNFLSNYIANQQQQQQQQLQQQNPSPGQPILGGGSKSTTGLFFSSSSTSAPSSNSTNNYKSNHSSGAQQAVIGQELMEVLTNLLGMKGMNLNTTSIVGGHLAGNSPRQSTPFEQQSSNGGNHVIPGGVPQPFQPFQQAAAAAAAAALTNLNNGRHKFNSNPNNLMAPPPPPPPPTLQTGDRVLINQSSPPDGKNADDSGAMIDSSVMMIDGLLGKALLSGPSSTNDDDILDVTTFTRRLRAVLNNNYSSASASQQQQDTSATTAVNENGGGTLALDLSAMFPDMNMSSFGKDIEDETNAYFQRIYNRPPHPIMCLDDFLRMLKTFRDSPERREREVFACMIRNLFEEYRFFSTYPEKELHITSCLFGGLIEKGICNYVGLGIALRFVLEALKKPNKSDKMRYFGLTALDTFKERLKEYPQYCYHIAQIPHFTEEFPPYLTEYVEFGMKGQDVIGQIVKIPAPNPSKSFTPPPANAPPVQAQASITTTSTATTTTTPSNQQPSIMSITNPTQQPTTSTNSSSNLQNTNNLLAMNPDSLLNPDNEIEEEENKGNFLVPPEPIQDKIAFIFNNLSLANINQKTEEIMDLLADENFPWVARYIAMKRASIENNFHTLYANFLDCIGKPQLNLLIIKDTFRNIKILLKSDKSAGNFSDRSLLKNLGHWLGLLTIAKNKPLLQSEIDLKQLVLDAALKGLQELLYVIPFAAKILESCSKSKVFKPPNPWTMGIMHLLAEIHKEPDMKLNLKFEIEMLCKTLNLDINTLVKNSRNELGRYKDRLIVLASMNEQQAAAAAQSQEQHTQSSNLGNLSSNLLPQQFAQQFQQFQQQLQNYQSSSQPSALPFSKFGKFGGPQQLAAFNNRGGAAGVLGNLPPSLSGLPPHLLSPAGFFSMMLMQQQQQQAQGLKDSSQQQLISDLLASLTSGGGTSGGGGGMLTSSTTPPPSSVSEMHQPPPPSTTTTLIMTSSSGTTSNQNTNTASTNKQQQFLATLLANLSNSANAGAVPPIKMPPTFGGGGAGSSSIMPGSGSGNSQQQNAAMIQHQLQQMIAAYASGQGPQQHTPASAASQPAHLQQPSKFGGPPMLGSTVSTVAQGGRLSQPPGIGGATSQDGTAQYQQRSTSTTGTVSPKFRYIDIDITNGAAFLAQKLVINASLFKNEIQALLPALRQFARLALEKSLTEILPPLTERVLKITVSTAECLIKKDFAFDPDENRVRAASHHLIRFLAGGISLYTVREPLYASLLANFKNALAIGLKGMSIAPLVTDQQLTSDETQDSSSHSALTGAAGSAQGTSSALGSRQNAGTSSATNNEFIEHAASVLAADNFELACCFAQKSVIERAVNELDRRWALIYLAASNKPRPFGSRTTLSASLPPSETATIDRLPPKIKPKMGGPNPNQAVVYEIFSKTIPGFQSHHQSKSNFAANLFPFQVGGSGSNTTPALGGVGSTPGGSTFAHNFSDTTGGLGTGMNEFSTSKYTTSPPQHTTVGRNTSGSVGLASGTDGPPFLHSRILAKLGVELDKCLLSMGVASENTVVNINTSALDTYVKPLVPISVLIRNVAGILAPVKDVSSANLNVIPLNLTSILGVNQPSSLMIGGSDETVHSSAVVISNTVLSGLQSLISKCLEGLQACFKTLDAFSGVGAEGCEVTSKMVNLPSINTSCTEEIEELINPSSSNNQLPDDNTTTPSNTKNPLANSPPAKIKDAYLLILKTLQDSRVFGPQLVNKQITKCLMENKDDIGIDLEVFYVLYGNKLINTQLYDTYLSQCVLDNTSINNGALSMTDAFITKLIRRACCEDDGRDAFPLADSDFYKTIDTLFHYISRPGRRFNLDSYIMTSTVHINFSHLTYPSSLAPQKQILFNSGVLDLMDKKITQEKLNQTLIKIRDNSDIVFLHTYNINLASPQTHTAAGGTGVENGNNSTTSGTQHQQHLNVEMSANNIYTGIFHSGISASKDFDDPPGLKEKVTYLYREWLETFYGFSRGDSSSMGTSNMSPPTNTGLLNFNSNMTPPLLATGAGGMGSSNFDKTSSSLTGGGLGATNITPFNNNPSTRQQQYAASSTPAVSINPESAITNFMMQMHQQGIFKTDDLITRFFRICTEICLEACYKALAERFALPVIPPNDYPSKTIIGPPTGGKSSTSTRNLLATSSPPPPSSVSNNSLLMFNVSFEERYKREILAQVKCYQHVDAYVKLIALLVKHSNQSLNNGTQVNLTNKVLGIFAGILIQHHRYPSFTIPGGTFQSLPFFRLFSVLYAEIVAMQALMDTHGGNIITAFCNAYHVIRPSEAPGFAYSWLELIAHRTFIGKTLTYPSQSKIWNYYALLLTDIFKFLAPYLRNVDLTDSLIYFYNGCLRLLLVLLHDFPEFLCDFHYGFCDIIPPNCIQMRNLILSAFPRDMRLPDPFTPNLKVDMLPEIGTSPKLTPYTDFGRMLCEHSMMSYSNSDEDLNTYASAGSDSHLNPVPNFGLMDATTSGFSESATSSTTNFASNETVLQFKKCLDVYLKTRSPVTFLTDIRPNLQRDPSPGSHYNIPLLNALVMYVGTQAIASIQNKGLTPGLSTITHSAHMDIFQNLAVGLDTEGRYLFLNAIANQLRYPNSHTHYFSCILLHLFAEANIEAIQEQITRVLLERLIVNRPHPWGLLITFIELIKNPSFHFWEHEFVRCAPEIEKLFDSVSKSCMQSTKLPVIGTSGPSMVPPQPPPPHGSVSTTLQPPTGFSNVNNARSQPVIPPSYH